MSKGGANTGEGGPCVEVDNEAPATALCADALVIPTQQHVEQQQATPQHLCVFSASGCHFEPLRLVESRLWLPMTDQPPAPSRLNRIFPPLMSSLAHPLLMLRHPPLCPVRAPRPPWSQVPSHVRF
jgi:hypothetical protein